MIKKSKPSVMGDPNMLLPVSVLGLPVRTIEPVIQTYGVTPTKEFFLAHLLNLSEENIESVPGMNPKRVGQIVAALAERGYRPGDADDLAVYVMYQGGKDAVLNHLRMVFSIRDHVPTPTDWVKIEGREPLNIPARRKAPVLTSQFSAVLNVAVPHAITDDQSLAKIKELCQKAFEIAVDDAILHARHSSVPKDVQKPLRAKLPFDETANYKTGAFVNVEVTLSPHMTAMLNRAFLKPIVQSLDNDALKAFIAPVLD